MSDHKPISGFYEITLEAIIPEKFQNIHSLVLRQFDRLENDARPAITISSEELDFGSISFLDPVTRSIMLENTGTVDLLSTSHLIIGHRTFRIPRVSTKRTSKSQRLHLHSSLERLARSKRNYLNRLHNPSRQHHYPLPRPRRPPRRNPCP
jgi:hypothetical protein